MHFQIPDKVYGIESVRIEVERIWEQFEEVEGTMSEKFMMLLHESRGNFLEYSRQSFQQYKRKEFLLGSSLSLL